MGWVGCNGVSYQDRAKGFLVEIVVVVGIFFFAFFWHGFVVVLFDLYCIRRSLFLRKATYRDLSLLFDSTSISIRIYSIHLQFPIIIINPSFGLLLVSVLVSLVYGPNDGGRRKISC